MADLKDHFKKFAAAHGELHSTLVDEFDIEASESYFVDKQNDYIDALNQAKEYFKGRDVKPDVKPPVTVTHGASGGSISSDVSREELLGLVITYRKLSSRCLMATHCIIMSLLGHLMLMLTWSPNMGTRSFAGCCSIPVVSRRKPSENASSYVVRMVISRRGRPWKSGSVISTSSRSTSSRTCDTPNRSGLLMTSVS